jgi:SOS-response transcriptional repressor LexA
MQVGLTPRQRQVFLFLREYIASEGVAPSHEEIAAHLGVAGKGAVHKLVIALEQRGYISRQPYKDRSICITESDPLSHTTTDDLIRELQRRGMSVPCPLNPGSEQAGDGATEAFPHSDLPSRLLNSSVHADGYAFSEQPNHG